jgi:hypothetical protein
MEPLIAGVCDGGLLEVFAITALSYRSKEKRSLLLHSHHKSTGTCGEASSTGTDMNLGVARTQDEKCLQRGVTELEKRSFCSHGGTEMISFESWSGKIYNPL